MSLKSKSRENADAIKELLKDGPKGRSYLQSRLGLTKFITVTIIRKLIDAGELAIISLSNREPQIGLPCHLHPIFPDYQSHENRVLNYLSSTPHARMKLAALLKVSVETVKTVVANINKEMPNQVVEYSVLPARGLGRPATVYGLSSSPPPTCHTVKSKSSDPLAREKSQRFPRDELSTDHIIPVRTRTIPWSETLPSSEHPFDQMVSSLASPTLKFSPRSNRSKSVH